MNHPARIFLEALYGNQTGVLELRTFDHPKANKLRDFIQVIQGQYEWDRVQRFLQGTEKHELGAFFGVALRTNASLKSRKGDGAHCQVLTALFVDADFKHQGEEETIRQISRFPLAPSMVVHSGGGLHPYWILKEPIFLQMSGGMNKAKQVLRRLAKTVAGVVDESVSEPVRVLRIPTSFNFKKAYPEPKEVKLLIPPTGVTYSLEDIASAVGEVIGTSEENPSGVFEVPEEIKQGDRHGEMFKLIRSLKTKGLDFEAAFAACQKTNLKKCDPPIPEHVLREYLERCWKQQDRPEFEPKQDSGFVLTSKGDRILGNNQENIRRALVRLGISLSFDAFCQKPFIKYNGYAGVLQDTIRNRAWLEIDEKFGFRPSGEFFDVVLQDVAHAHKYHPVRQYLDTLTWDGEKRLDTWLIKAGKAAETDFVKAVSSLILIAAVRRVVKPGFKFDEMLVLESKQGLQKSSALAALCPFDHWFSDDLPLNVDAKQIIERTVGKWIIESAELSGMGKSDQEHLKSMLSRRVDGPVRLAYARLPVEVPRQFIIVGTTNSHNYLKDPTGNRRFWPVRVETFDIPWIITNRDQIWAEAAHRELAGESTRLNPRLWAHAEMQQERRRPEDAWEDPIASAFVDEYQRLTMAQIWDLLGIPMDRRDDRGMARISNIMQRLGFKRMTIRPKGVKPSKGWGRGEKLIDDIPIEDQVNDDF